MRKHTISSWKSGRIGVYFFWAFVLVAQCACVTPSGAATGIRALDEPAIALKSPHATFLDAVTVEGNRIVAVGAHGAIIYSDDSGKTWTQASVPVDATLTAIAFVDSTHGWAVGNSGIILNTDDAGRSWKVQLNGIQAEQLTLSAAEAAVAQNSVAIGSSLAVRRANHLLEMGPSVPFLSILVQSPQKVIVFGAFKMTMITVDGGKTWQDASLSIGDRVSHHLYDAAQIGGGIYVVGEAGLVFRSADGGNTFPQVSAAGSATLFGVIGSGDGGVLVYGIAGLVYRSDDAGQSWTQIVMPSGADLLDAITLPGGKIILLSESGVVYESKDFGRSFAPLPAILPMATYALAQAPDGSIIVVGNRGVMSLSGE